MASAVCSEMDTGMAFMNRAVRSLSHTSQPVSPIDAPSPPLLSPLIPATPTNTPGCQSPDEAASSPPTALPPANSPASNLDSGLTSPTDEDTTIQFHPPDFLKLHHFHSPLLWPTAPPNSPEAFPITGDAMGSIDEVHTILGERLAALTLATSKKDGISTTEMKILKENVPKAPENDWYEIRAIPGKGYGCFVKTLIPQGTRILADDPLLVVPVANYYMTDVQAAFEKLSPADQALYFTLHSAHGQDPKNWPKHIHESVTKDERCRIEEQHKARVGKEPTLVSIFQTNCMELEKGAAVFPHAARFNHSCNPNATFTWNSAIKKETIHVMRDIQKDEEITFSYCDMTLDRATRRWSLKHYGFACDCPACAGDETDEECFAGQTAARRYRLMELDNLFGLMDRAKCVAEGTKNPEMIAMLLEYINLLMAEGDHTLRLAQAYLDVAIISAHAEDLKSAFSYARGAVKVSTDCLGSDHPTSHKYVKVMEQAKHARLAQLAQLKGKRP